MNYHVSKTSGCILLSFLIASAIFVVGCHKSVAYTSEITEPDQTANNNDTQIANNSQLTITPLDAENLFETKANVLIIDVRPLSSYVISHITKAVSIPIEEFENTKIEIPQDRQIIVYAQCH